MTEDTNNDGWYYIYLPTYVNKIIFNATDSNGNAVQTDGDGIDTQNKFKFEAKNQWIDGVHEETKTNEDGSSSTIYMPNTPSYTQLTSGELPIYEEESVIYARVPNDWNKAIAHFSSDNIETTYTLELPYNSTEKWYIGRVPTKFDKVYLTNGESGENLKESVELKVTNSPYYIQVSDTVKEGKYDASVVYEKPVDASEVFTVHAKVPSDWTQAGIWAWKYDGGAAAVTGGWPGAQMTLDADGWYTYDQVSTIADRVIINQFVFEGGLQTTDIAIEPKECWVVLTTLNENNQYLGDVYYEKPNLEEEKPDPTPDEGDKDPTPDEGDKDPTTEDLKKDGLTPGAIVGIVIGCVALVGIIVGTILFLKKKKNK